MNSIHIYTSKKKAILMLIGSIVFVVSGIWLLLETGNVHGWQRGNPTFNRAIAIVSILFFGFGIFVSIKTLIKSELAIIIDSTGLNLNLKNPLTEVIKWSDILGFEEIRIRSTRIVIIGVKNPEHWLDKEPNIIRKKLMQFNINNFNTPFNIAAAGLDISSDELIEKLNEYFNEYKNEA